LYLSSLCFKTGFSKSEESNKGTMGGEFGVQCTCYLQCNYVFYPEVSFYFGGKNNWAWLSSKQRLKSTRLNQEVAYCQASGVRDILY